MNRLLPKLLGLLLISGLSLTAYAGPTLEEGKQAESLGQYAKASEVYRSLADQGDRVAQYQLAQLYFRGLGVAQDREQAASLYRKSAEQGYVEAQYMLASLHFRRELPLRDYQEAVQWYRRAAEQGHVKSQLNLGDLYFKGEVVELDVVEAMRWFRLAAAQGEAVAQHHMGMMYIDGQGVPADVETGYMWLVLAMQNADPRYSIKLSKILNFIGTKLTEPQKASAVARAERCRNSKYQEC